jgi:hypothetical protein
LVFYFMQPNGKIKQSSVHTIQIIDRQQPARPPDPLSGTSPILNAGEHHRWLESLLTYLLFTHCFFWRVRRQLKYIRKHNREHSLVFDEIDFKSIANKDSPNESLIQDNLHGLLFVYIDRSGQNKQKTCNSRRSQRFAAYNSSWPEGSSSS